MNNTQIQKAIIKVLNENGIPKTAYKIRKIEGKLFLRQTETSVANFISLSILKLVFKAVLNLNGNIQPISARVIEFGVGSDQ